MNNVRDFISTINLTLTLINSLKDGVGSGQEYRDLVYEFYLLQKALIEIKDLQLDDSLISIKNTIQQTVYCC
jgi:hypothetical protein